VGLISGAELACRGHVGLGHQLWRMGFFWNIVGRINKLIVQENTKKSRCNL
jgi:hypothetical protein